MKIINKTKNIVIAAEACVADSFYKRLKGLLGCRGLKTHSALIIKPCNSVHTFFMKFPIDVLFLDKNNKVIKLKQSLKPFRISPLYFNARVVIELPAGTAKATNTCEEDLITLESGD